MVKVLVAPDKFKGSLTAKQVCNAVSLFFASNKKYDVSTLPLADGGEGTFEILLDYFQGTERSVLVHDPLLRKVNANYGIAQDGKTALIEMAKASGLQLLNENERNPLVTTTFGTGELITHAMQHDVKSIILGIGGSATNDGGIGMAKALGFRFLNSSGNEVKSLGGQELANIASIDRSNVDPRLSEVEVTTLCDVKNPLTGPDGASQIFARQKGASAGDIKILEQGMIRFERLLNEHYGFSTQFEGAGAAGGLGAGAAYFLNSKLRKGMDFISNATSLEKRISESDIIITGEGKLDTQSLSGKVVHHVCALAKKYQKKVIVLCGVLELEEHQLQRSGIDECLTLSDGVNTENSINNAFELIIERLRDSRILGTL